MRRVPVVLAAVNALVVVALWAGGRGFADVHDAATALASAGRVCGLLGAYLALVQLVLLARPSRIAWHRINGQLCLGLLLAHAGLILAGYAVGDGGGPLTEAGRLISGYPGVITAVAALVLLVAVTVTSIGIARRRLRYETWYFTH